VLIAADDALKSAVEAGDWASQEVDKKFGKAIYLLSDLEKDFPSVSDPNIGGTVTGEANMCDNTDKSESFSAILRALEKNLFSKVKFLFVSLPLNADES
jgi:hypothetical protein